MNLLDLLQWPAMVVTIVASWLVASSHAGKRNAGFWVFLVSNALWVAWALHADAPALIALQVGLAAMNVRGAVKTERPSSSGASEPSMQHQGKAMDPSRHVIAPPLPYDPACETSCSSTATRSRPPARPSS